jgi:hypothetical protein
MSVAIAGSNDSLDATLTTQLDDAQDVYLFCWFKVTEWVASDTFIVLGTTLASTENVMVLLSSSSVDDRWLFQADAVALSSLPLDKNVDGVWTPILFRHRVANRSAYLADVTDTSSASVTLGLLDQLAIGENLNNAGDAVVKIAEVAIWYGDDALSAQDIADLLGVAGSQTGKSPSVVAPASLRLHCSMATDWGAGPVPNTGLDAGGDLTVNGNGLIFDSDHPTMTFGTSVVPVLMNQYRLRRN